MSLGYWICQLRLKRSIRLTSAGQSDAHPQVPCYPLLVGFALFMGASYSAQWPVCTRATYGWASAPVARGHDPATPARLKGLF